MSVPFHALQRHAHMELQSGLDALRTQSSSLHSAVLAVRHYYSTLLAPDQINLYAFAAFVFLTEANFEKAAQRFSRLLRIPSPERGRQLLLQAINLARPGMLGNDESLYQKGLIRTSQKYLPVQKGLEKGSNFDVLRQRIVPVLLPILDPILDWAMGGKSGEGDSKIDSTTLRYAAAALLPDKTRDFAFNALSLEEDRTLSQHRDHVSEAGRAISQAATVVGIRLDDFGIGGFASIREQNSISPTRGKQKTNISDRRQMRLLKMLVQQGQISNVEARLYHQHKRMPTWDSLNPQIRQILAKVEDAINHIKGGGLDAMPVNPSDADFHQARAVRP